MPGEVMYWRLLLPTAKVDSNYDAKDNGTGLSWLALNNWPTKRVPNWHHVPVFQTPGSKADLWTVHLLSITFIYEPGGAEQSTTKVLRPPHALDHITVIMDTGASSSWVPYGVISQLRSIFSSDVNRELEAQHSGEYSGTPVIGSAHLHLSGEIADQISANKWKMFYEFEGTNGKRIKIRGPPSPFICDASSDSGKNKPADGLLFALPDSSQPGSENSGLAIFGLNFFQSMVVAMHRPNSARPFLQLAPQWPKDYLSEEWTLAQLAESS
ncbi:hypothetical protein FOMPIDRAFT_85316 [Fomitopsis schrenkii]|uniref:Peptidase A1 domain-containing protein n=1 Tax=Fomitopsis schrenkii TaxID=2126942 RepID=S8DVJ2_FOMSC|nr:hypothetical protein FOMPIDRAFT_85316 [Fomitopsis schrenkii]